MALVINEKKSLLRVVVSSRVLARLSKPIVRTETNAEVIIQAEKLEPLFLFSYDNFCTTNVIMNHPAHHVDMKFRYPM